MSVIIFRYLTKEILVTMLATTLLLLVIVITNQSLQFLQRAAMGQLPVTEIVHAIVLQVPLLMGYLLPLGLYLGVLLTLGRMSLESEMTVLNACGMSRITLAGMVLMIALWVAIVVLWLMAVVVPKAQGELNAIINKAAVTASVAQVIPGRFMMFDKKSENPIVFYAAHVKKNHALLQHVFLARQSMSKKGELEKWDVVVAKTASEKTLPNATERYIIFNHGYRYSGVPGEKNYQVLRFDQYGELLKIKNIPTPNAAQDYSLSQLWSLHSQDKQVAAEFQWRLAMPISTLVFALLAVPLSEVRPRHGKFTQLFPAILIYMGYADLIFLTRSWIGSGRLSPALGMWWVHASVLLIAIILLLYRTCWFRLRLRLLRGAA